MMSVLSFWFKSIYTIDLSWFIPECQCLQGLRYAVWCHLPEWQEVRLWGCLHWPGTRCQEGRHRRSRVPHHQGLAEDLSSNVLSDSFFGLKDSSFEWFWYIEMKRDKLCRVTTEMVILSGATCLQTDLSTPLDSGWLLSAASNIPTKSFFHIWFWDILSNSVRVYVYAENYY